jgi:hypothetical protein
MKMAVTISAIYLSLIIGDRRAAPNSTVSNDQLPLFKKRGLLLRKEFLFIFS